MTGVAVVDTNLLVLLVVGAASRDYIAKHKRLQDYTADDFELLGLMIADFSEIVILPHILAETSNLCRQIDNPARSKIQNAFRVLITSTLELPIQSSLGVQRADFDELGLTDALILHFCSMEMNGVSPTLITSDRRLANRAFSFGYSVIDYRQEFQDRL
jgi:hypothetical protein